jgi:hypothetical protein
VGCVFAYVCTVYFTHQSAMVQEKEEEKFPLTKTLVSLAGLSH